MPPKDIGKLFGALILAAATAWAGYLWAGARRAEEVQSELLVLKAEIKGEFGRMADEQQRTREDIQRLTKAVDEMAARRR